MTPFHRTAAATALLTACYYNQFMTLITLLEAGGCPSSVNRYGDTALILASQKGHLKIVELLE
jgi:ankyrin repeat protein